MGRAANGWPLTSEDAAIPSPIPTPEDDAPRDRFIGACRVLRLCTLLSRPASDPDRVRIRRNRASAAPWTTAQRTPARWALRAETARAYASGRRCSTAAHLSTTPALPASPGAGHGRRRE